MQKVTDIKNEVNSKDGEIYEIPAFIPEYLEKYLCWNPFFAVITENGIKLRPSKRRGNSAYAYYIGREQEKRCNALERSGKSHLFITLTVPTVFSGRHITQLESWEIVRKELPKYLRKLKAKRFGMVDYVYNVEATLKGYCHVHILASFARNIEVISFINQAGRKILILKDKGLWHDLKSKWIYISDIQGVYKKDVAAYFTKHTGKIGALEPSLKRARKGLQNKNDVKKMKGYFHLIKLGMRSWGSSKGLKEKFKNAPNGEAEALDCLVDDKNKSTQIVLLIPDIIKKDANFDCLKRFYDKQSWLYKAMKGIYGQQMIIGAAPEQSEPIKVHDEAKERVVFVPYCPLAIPPCQKNVVGLGNAALCSNCGVSHNARQ